MLTLPSWYVQDISNFPISLIFIYLFIYCTAILMQLKILGCQEKKENVFAIQQSIVRWYGCVTVEP